MNNPNIILHPTDFSPDATYALELACDLAKDHRARLIILHVAAPLRAHVTEMGLSVDRSHKEWLDAEAQLNRLNCRGLQPERLLRVGEPATVILSVTRQVNADLIVIGQPRPSRWRWLLEERVAESLVQTSPCPVLIVTKPKPHPAQLQELGGKVTS